MHFTINYVSKLTEFFWFFMKYNFGKLQMYFIETADILCVNVLFETYFIHSYKKTMKNFTEQNKKGNNSWAPHNRWRVAVGSTCQFEPC